MKLEIKKSYERELELQFKRGSALFKFYLWLNKKTGIKVRK